MSQFYQTLSAGNLPSTVVETITGNEGGAVPAIDNNINLITTNTTLEFVGNPLDATISIDFGIANLLLGTSGPSIDGASQNSSLGYLALNSLTTGGVNCAIGETALASLTTGDECTALGYGALAHLISGSECIALGYDSGSAYTSNESGNIVIGSTGVVGDQNVIRIGLNQSSCYIQGIANVAVGNQKNVMINSSTGQLGAVSNSYFSQINIQTFISSGTYTPTSGMKYCVIEAIGGGGGGGGVIGGVTTAAAAGGGGGGAYARGAFSAAAIGASQTVTIGSGGTGGNTSGTSGVMGGTTSVGSLVSASGGSPGTGVTTSAATGVSIGGVGSNPGFIAGQFTAQGGAGSNGFWSTVAGFAIAGSGGGAGLGGGNSPQKTNANNGGGDGVGGSVFGGGGGGGVSYLSATGFSGGTGEIGYVVITEYI